MRSCGCPQRSIHPSSGDVLLSTVEIMTSWLSVSVYRHVLGDWTP